MSEPAKMDIPFGRPWITDEDRRAVADVLDGHILTHGPRCAAFEEAFTAYIGGGHCVTTSSCMAALHLASLGLGLGPGDEVVVTAETHVATAHAVELTGARPVFVDCDPATGNIDPELVEQAVTDRTKAISLVHFLGIPAPMPRIMEIAHRHGLKVIEDCATAIGTRFDGKHAGLYGDAGCFSFYPSKQLTAAEGGMFVTRHKELADAVRKIRGFGVDRTYQERSLPGMYDAPWLGLNYRMSELQAALGRSQLARVDDILERRSGNFAALKARLESVPDIRIIDSVDPPAANGHYCMGIALQGTIADRRDEVIAGLRDRGVGTSIHYPHPVPRIQYYRQKYGYDSARFPHATEISDRSIDLPVAPHVGDAEIDYIAKNLVEVIGELEDDKKD